MADKPPKGKVIDITALLKRRRIGWTPPGATGKPKADGNEIPPPPRHSRRPTRIPPMPKGRGQLAKALDALTPAVEVKKNPLIKRLMLKLPEWMTPNFVTCFRALFAIPIIMLGRNNQDWWTHGSGAHYWAILALFLFASFLDFVDGAIAEARGSGSVTGKFLDPFADKIVVFSTLFAVMENLPYPWIAAILLFSIPLAVVLTINRLVKLVIGSEEIAANPAGKLKLVMETVGVSLCLLSMPLALPIMAVVGMIFLSLATGLAILSLSGQIS